jgi:hypothetical protein
MKKRQTRDAEESLSAASPGWGARIGAIEDENEYDSPVTDEQEFVETRGRKKKDTKNLKHVTFQDVMKTANEVSHYSVTDDDVGVNCRACRLGYFVNSENTLADQTAEFVRKFAYSISLPALIEQVYKIGEEERRRTIEQGFPDPGEWTREDVEYHLFYCMTDMTLWNLKQLNDHKRLLTSLKNQLFDKNTETGEIVANEKVWKLMIQVETHMKNLWTVVPEKAVSFNSKLIEHSSKRKFIKQ